MAIRNNSVKHLICDGLGFCCLWMFFQKYKRTSMIALRLGVTPRAVRLWKARWRSGELQCENSDRCLKERLSLKGRLDVSSTGKKVLPPEQS